MYYYLYETKNLVNNKIYIGVHQTENLDDGYLGSGKLFTRAMKKHGKENFEKKILRFFSSKEEMFEAEKEAVNLSFLKRKDVYNLQEGGSGARRRLTENKENFEPRGRAGGLATFHLKVAIFDPEIQRKAVEKSLYPEFREKHKRRLKEVGSQQGCKNSQYGTMWITDDVSSKKIKNTDIIPEGWKRGKAKKIPQ